MDESRFYYLNLPFFGENHLIVYAVVWYVDPSKSGALTIVDINPKKITSAHTSSRRSELKQKYRKNLSNRITNELYKSGVNKDTSIIACKFFSETGPQWRDSANHKMNLLHRLEEYCGVEYPDKETVEIEGEEYLVHPEPVIRAHHVAGKYVSEVYRKLQSMINGMKNFKNEYELLNSIWSLDGCRLDNGIPGTLYISPLLQNELYFTIKK